VPFRDSFTVLRSKTVLSSFHYINTTRRSSFFFFSLSVLILPLMALLGCHFSRTLAAQFSVNVPLLENRTLSCFFSAWRVSFSRLRSFPPSTVRTNIQTYSYSGRGRFLLNKRYEVVFGLCPLCGIKLGTFPHFLFLSIRAIGFARAFLM